MNNEQLKIIADRLEDEINKYLDKNWDCDEMIAFIKGKMNEAKQRNRWKGKRKPRSW